MGNDAGVITRRGPDSVRGPDVAYYSYARVPRGTLPRTSYLDVAPDLVVEVLSPDDRWPAVQAKVAEYLEAGVLEVLVLDPEGRRAFLFSAERAPAVVTEGEEVELLGEFRKVVGSFFE